MCICKIFIQLSHKVIAYAANNHLNPNLIPELWNNLGVNACDAMFKHEHKNKVYCPHNYYNDNKYRIAFYFDQFSGSA